jgi:hypothetical protein
MDARAYFQFSRLVAGHRRTFSVSANRRTNTENRIAYRIAYELLTSSTPSGEIR